MATAFGSSTVTEVQGDGDVDATKPSGLSAGDMMVAFCFRNDAGSGTPDDFDTPTGWTKLGTVDSGDDRITTFAKIADSSDASASTFTFSLSGTSGDLSVVILTRTTGESFASTSDNIVSSSGTDTSSGGEDFVSFSGLTPVSSDSLLMMVGSISSDIDTLGSGYAVANNDPTWTEQHDGLYDPSGVGTNYFLASAIYSPSTATGDFSYTPTENGVYTGFLVSVRESNSATGTHNLVDMDSTIFQTDISVGTTASHNILPMDSQIFTHTATAKNPLFTLQSKNTANFTLQNKS